MKKIIINLSEKVLSDCAYRNKIDIVKLCLNYVKFAPFAYVADTTDGNCILQVDKMKRLFITFKNSVHSIHFPFNVYQNGESIEFYYDEKELDAKTTSILLDFFERFNMFETMEDMYDMFLRTLEEYDISGGYNENYFWKLICHMLVFEPAYLRYDEDFSSRMNPETHPAYHFDINYCNTSTFKLGLQRKISMDDYIKFLDINETCTYVKL